jgi:hypothetical protein
LKAGGLTVLETQILAAKELGVAKYFPLDLHKEEDQISYNVGIIPQFKCPQGNLALYFFEKVTK